MLAQYIPSEMLTCGLCEVGYGGCAVSRCTRIYQITLQYYTVVRYGGMPWSEDVAAAGFLLRRIVANKGRVG